MLVKRPSLLDLFAGCGGLSLGLESSESQFDPLLFSEINPAAASTYLLNRSERTFRRIEDLDKRAFREPLQVGDVKSLSNQNLGALLKIWEKEGVPRIDLVCGGPPCQGYSGIGHRRTFDLHKEEIPSNFLFKEMVRVIKVTQPKVFLFENVRGLLTSKWTKGGKGGEIFRDVISTFLSLKEYGVRWQLVHAKDYGVPQNRPRVLVIGIHRDLIKLPPPKQSADTVILPTAVSDGLLPKPVGNAPSPPELLGDLVDRDYRKTNCTPQYPSPALTEVQKHLRKQPDGTIAKKGAPVSEQEYSGHSDIIIKKFLHMIQNGGEIPLEMQTKKFSQKVLPREWPPSGPNITATSMPDDYVHYEQPRILTVREWARLQTFPDWYRFAGPRTTGGRRRAGDPSAGIWDREVPKYTQIGNAVPVLLAQRIGTHLKNILGG